MKSARERAIDGLARARAIEELTGEWASAEVHAKHAEGLVDTIESSGLSIVDRDLFDALVEAVRASQWAGAPHPSEDGFLERMLAEGDIERVAHARAPDPLREALLWEHAAMATHRHGDLAAGAKMFAAAATEVDRLLSEAGHE